MANTRDGDRMRRRSRGRRRNPHGEGRIDRFVRLPSLPRGIDRGLDAARDETIANEILLRIRRKLHLL